MIHTLLYNGELEKDRFTREQAKKSIEVWMNLMDQNFATKTDLKEWQFVSRTELQEGRLGLQKEIEALRSELKEDIHDLRSEIKSIRFEMQELENRLILRLGVMLAGSIGILSTLMVLLRS